MLLSSSMHPIEVELSVSLKDTTDSPALRISAGEVGRRGLLKDKAYAEIKKRILSGEFGPGTFLSERQLAALLEMSKTPIRAALERLENDGFVRVSPQQGIVVCETTLQQMADQFEIRIALESFVVRELAGRLSQPQADELEANLGAQRANNDVLDIERMVVLDAEFHTLLCEFFGNEEILRVMSRLREKVHRAIYAVTGHDLGRIVSSYEEHRAIADAILAGKADLAVDRLVQHLEFGKRRVLSRRG